MTASLSETECALSVRGMHRRFVMQGQLPPTVFVRDRCRCLDSAGADMLAREMGADASATCVFKVDAFHTLQRILRATDGPRNTLFKGLAGALSDALFVAHEPDVRELLDKIKQRGNFKGAPASWPKMVADLETLCDLLHNNPGAALHVPKAFRQKIRRSIPPPELLVPRLQAAMQQFRGLACSKTGRVLITPATERVFALQLTHAQHGCLSDWAPTENMYILCANKAGGGFPFMCLRSTSQQEGMHNCMARVSWTCR